MLKFMINLYNLQIKMKVKQKIFRIILNIKMRKKEKYLKANN